jgi:hypothetical protein
MMAFSFYVANFRTMRAAHGVVLLHAMQMLAGTQLLCFMNLMVSVGSNKPQTSLPLLGT